MTSSPMSIRNVGLKAHARGVTVQVKSEEVGVSTNESKGVFMDER